MRVVRHFDERIYDPELGEGASSTQVVAKYKDEPNVFMSFTQIDKLGINPQSQYDTPIGIYTYPVKAFFETYVPHLFRKDGEPSVANQSAIGDFAPFAGKAPFVWIVRFTGKEEEIIRDIKAGYNAIQLKEDTERLLPFLLEKLRTDDEQNREKTGMSPEDYDMRYGTATEAIARQQIEIYASDARSSSPGGQFWNITRKIAKQTADITTGTQARVQWNKILRETLGYRCIVDLEGGILHPNEPIQAVFFEKSAFEVIDKIDNAAAALKKRPVMTYKEFEQLNKIEIGNIGSVLKASISKERRILKYSIFIKDILFLRPQSETEAHYTELLAASLEIIANQADTTVRPQFSLAHEDDDMSKEILSSSELTEKIITEYRDALQTLNFSSAVKNTWNKYMKGIYLKVAQL